MHSLSINTKEFMTLLWDTRYSRIFDYLDNTVASKLLDVDEIIGESQSVHYKRFDCNDFALLKKVALILSDVNDETTEMLGSIVQSISKQIVDLKTDNVLHDGILDILLQDYVEKIIAACPWEGEYYRHCRCNKRVFLVRIEKMCIFIRAQITYTFFNLHIYIIKNDLNMSIIFKLSILKLIIIDIKYMIYEVHITKM